ncbi:PREDICTED: uncharacterized protein LOC108377634 [Rhagoletis zephyria]|uniref:uncharacterized protein LOC108377634 n=1 Tax=Rhagoletis zephyria TaxID=28612 RepID=UPI0008112775|nr:PREDICTED: uncharacterized protein LOC108377634 [Rhagoletis zephyria]
MKRKHPTQIIARQTGNVVNENNSESRPPPPQSLQLQQTNQPTIQPIARYFNKSIALKKRKKKRARKSVSSTLLINAYSEVMEPVKERLKRAFAVGLTVDGWTSRAQDHFFSVTAHYIVDDDKPAFLASDLLTCMSYTNRHTAVNITKMLADVLKEWNIAHKFTVIVWDMKAAVRGGGGRHWGCFAHTLNLVAQSGLKEVGVVLEKVKAIVRLFTKSSYASSQLKQTMEGMQMQPLKATVLDPRFKKFGFINESNYKTTVRMLYNKFASVRVQSDISLESDVDREEEVNLTNIQNQRLDKVRKDFDAEVQQNLRQN